MKTTIQNVALVLVGFIAGGFLVHSFSSNAVTTVQTAGASPSGSTFSTRKQAAIVVNLASPGANGTSTSVTNTDANQRYVTGYEYGCNGVGTSYTAYTGTALASLQMTIGTTSTANSVTIPSVNPVANVAIIGTSSVYTANASTSVTTANPLAARWDPGVAMTFWFNATNTAVCTVSVDYLGS